MRTAGWLTRRIQKGAQAKAKKASKVLQRSVTVDTLHLSTNRTHSRSSGCVKDHNRTCRPVFVKILYDTANRFGLSRNLNGSFFYCVFLKSVFDTLLIQCDSPTAEFKCCLDRHNDAAPSNNQQEVYRCQGDSGIFIASAQKSYCMC